MRQRTVLNPKASYKSTPQLSDYVLVNNVDTYGTWKLHDLITIEEGASLMILANWLEKGKV